MDESRKIVTKTQIISLDKEGLNQRVRSQKTASKRVGSRAVVMSVRIWSFIYCANVKLRRYSLNL